jgi:hypothetical protein
MNFDFASFLMGAMITLIFIVFVTIITNSDNFDPNVRNALFYDCVSKQEPLSSKAYTAAEYCLNYSRAEARQRYRMSQQ